MELNWSTFILEILNFLVLLWLLKRFLYQPVLAVIARRQAAITDGLAQARQEREQAEALSARYQNRLDEWQQERNQALEKLQQELAGQRSAKLQQLQEELRQEREKSRIAGERSQQAALEALQVTAQRQAAVFAAKLLHRLADAHLESRLFDFLLAELASLSPAQVLSLHSNGNGHGPVIVNSAFPLSALQQDRLRHVLEQLLPTPLAVEFREDSTLVAGFRLSIGAWVLGANLADELQAFADSGNLKQRSQP